MYLYIYLRIAYEIRLSLAGELCHPLKPTKYQVDYLITLYY